MSLKKSNSMFVTGVTSLRNGEEIEINVPIQNMAEYDELISLAKKQLNELSETLHKLYCLDITMKITF